MSVKAMIHLGTARERALKTIAQSGAELVANYGSSVLVRAEAAALEKLATQGLRVRELADSALQLGAYRVEPAGVAGVMSAAMAAPSAQAGGHHVIRIVGPLHPDWRVQLERSGVTVREWLDETSALASVAPGKLGDVQALGFVEAVLPYEAAMKVHANLVTADVHGGLKASAALAATQPFVAPGPTPAAPPKPVIRAVGRAAAADPDAGNLEVVLFDAGDVLRAGDAIRKAGAEVVRVAGERLIVKAEPKQIARIAAIPEVRAVNPFRPPGLHNNVAAGIMRTDVLHNDHELDGAGQIVAIADTGLDNGANDATMLDDFEGRIVNLFALGRPGDASDPNGHGTHVAGSVLGDGANSNGNIRGSAPAAQVVFQSIMDAGGGLGGLPANLGVGLFDVARDQGARIHTNSWGADVNGAYNANCTEADTFAFANREFLIVFSAGNDAPNRVGSPGSAKNVLTVGASESNRVLAASVNFPASPMFPGGATATGFNNQADNVNQVTAFSSVGPAQNNRRKPDVVAPGSWILSTRSSVSVYDAGPDGLGENEVGPGGTGDEDGVPTHAEAVGLGLPGQPIFGTGSANTPAAPPGSGAAATDNYMYLSGTSMATPLVAGACAQVRQYLVQQRGHTPSAALLKALMVNGAVDMGLGVPHIGQGWGRVDLANALFPAGTRRVQFDDTLDNAVATGDIRSYDIHVSNGLQPLLVTLVWRDPPGATIQNRLHLRVTHVATATTSTADPIADIRNNVQKVIVTAPAAGLWQVEVEGVNVATGVAELLPALRQDYALVVANASGFSCNPSDVVQVIDRSGSMGFSGYMGPAKERAKQMIDILQINDQAGVVRFNSAAQEVFPLTPIDNQDVKDDAHAVIDPITAGGTTDLREALDQGVTTLGADTGRPRAIVYLSDGKHTVASAPIDDPQLDAIAAANIRVYTIALGPDSDFAVLNNIANRTGTGAVHTVESAADLHKLHEIYYSIIGGIGCGGLVHLSSASLVEGLTETTVIDKLAREAHFAVSWHDPAAEIELRLRDPAGNILDAATTRALHVRGSTHAFYRVPLPQAGTWRMLLRVRKNPGNAALRVTTAALMDSEVSCHAELDRKFLIHGKLQLRLDVRWGTKPVLGGKALARITYPTVSIRELLQKHANPLKEIKIPKEALRRDKPDLDRLRLAIFAARQADAGKDIFGRKTVQLPLVDSNKTGRYSAFFDTRAAKVAGNFEVKVFFEAKSAKMGTHRCLKLLPVFVPEA